jgi:XTP/dITP diphosphohydrolase
LSDDSGLCVDALGGAPGIFSARWAGPSKDFRIAMQKVEHELRDRYALSPDQRNAHFVCALCLAIPGQEPSGLSWRGSRCSWSGHRVANKGFGYDPVFQPEGHQITFGEMDPDAKHAMSHRARAFAQLVGELKAAIG